MTVKVHDKYWELDIILHNISTVEEGAFKFALIKNDGFRKEFDNDRYTYEEIRK